MTVREIVNNSVPDNIGTRRLSAGIPSVSEAIGHAFAIKVANLVTVSMT